jgi:zinc transport system ATP-binding protein
LIKPLISVTNACLERDSVSVLHEITFKIDHDECVALLGPNGAGKSTLLHALVGLLPLSSGQIEICAGHDSNSGVALVPQFAPQTSLIPLSVFELVSSGLTFSNTFFGLSKTAKRSVQQALELVKLSNKAKSPYSSLSGGQLRRALIARALVSEPELLLLDEPLAGLDRESVAVLVEILQDLKASNRSMIVVSHELADLQSLFTRVIELDHRSIAYDGVPLDRHGHESHSHDLPPNPEIPGVLH